MDDRVSQKEDNVRAFESDVRDCKLFFYSQLENTRYRIPPRQIFLFCAELCTWRNLFHNLEKLERERERCNSDYTRRTRRKYAKMNDEERVASQKKGNEKKTRNENSMDENEFKTDGSRMEK